MITFNQLRKLIPSGEHNSRIYAVKSASSKFYHGKSNIKSLEDQQLSLPNMNSEMLSLINDLNSIAAAFSNVFDSSLHEDDATIPRTLVYERTWDPEASVCDQA